MIPQLEKPQEKSSKGRSSDLDSSVQRVFETRSLLEEKLRDYAIACTELKDTSRRDSNSLSGHLMFSNMNFRLAGAMIQALKRAGVSDKLLERSLRERREELENSRRSEAPRTKQPSVPSSGTTSLLPSHDDDFDVLFGEGSI